MDRRRFLRRTLLGGAVLALGGVVGKNLTGYSLDEKRARRLRVLSPKDAIILDAVVRRICAPDAPDAPSVDDVDAVGRIDRYLAHLPPHILSDIRDLLAVVEHGAFVSALVPSRFTRMDDASQDRVLRAWASSGLDVRRQGFQALKTLAMLGYYGDERTFALLGYGGPLVGARPQP